MKNKNPFKRILGRTFAARCLSLIHYMLILYLLSAFPARANAQNMENIGLKKGVKLNGGINWSHIFYATNGDQRRDPYSTILSGNLNVNLFGYDMPFTFTWSNNQRSYTQPFNRLSFTPQYKWVKAYLGYTSMTFSPYTLSGHSFLGGGLELSPGNWRFAMMAGQLNKAVEYDPLNHPDQNPAYKRMGYAVKAGYESGSNAIAVTLFTAGDDQNSIRQLPAEATLQPRRNLAIGFSGRTVWWSAVSIDLEYTHSLLNTNTRVYVVTSDTSGHTLSESSLLDKTATTRNFGAVNAGIGYNASNWDVQLRYERVAPDYQTLGAYYFNNDMENYTIAPNIRFFEGKLSVSANTGIQRNNLDNGREATTRRFVGAVNVNYTSGEQLNLSASYSNFSSYTRNRPSSDPFTTNPMDSLDFYQISNSINGMAGYNFGDKEKIRRITLNTSCQRMNNRSNREGGGDLSDFISGNAGYTHGFPRDMTLTAAINANLNNTSQMKSLYWGPSFSASKMFLEKTLHSGANVAYNQSRIDDKTDAPVLSTGINLSWSSKTKNQKAGKHNLNYHVTWIQRFKSETRPAQNELTGTLTYGYNF